MTRQGDGDRGLDGDTEPYRRGGTRRQEDPDRYEHEPLVEHSRSDPRRQVGAGEFETGDYDPVGDETGAYDPVGDETGAYDPVGDETGADGSGSRRPGAHRPGAHQPGGDEPTRRLRGAQPHIGSLRVGARRRDHTPAIRAAVALLLAALVLGGIALWGYRQLTGKSTAAPNPCPSGQTLQTAAPLTPALVRLRVTNGTSRSGLAGRTGDALRGRRFVVLGVGNAEKPLRGPAVIRYGTGAEPQARLLALQLPAARLQAVAGTPGTLELVLGSAFRRLRTPAQVTAATKTARVRGASVSPTATCR